MHKLALPTLLLAGLLLAGCGEDDGGDPMDTASGHPPAELVGDWVFQSATVDGAPVALGDALEWLPGTVRSLLHVQASSAYVYEEVNVAGGQLWFESGFVFVSGDQIDINAQLDSDGPADETVTFTFAVVADSLDLQMMEAGELVAFGLERDAP